MMANSNCVERILRRIVAAQTSLLVAYRINDHRKADTALTALEKATRDLKNAEEK